MPAVAPHRNAKLEPMYQQRLAGEPVIDVFRRLQPDVEALAPAADLS